MPVDYPDFGVPETSGAYPLIGDLGELAARLGSIVLFDRRGRVVDLDDFEGALLKWVITNTGASYSRFSSVSAKSGTQSVIMHVGGAGDTPTHMQRGFTLLSSKRLGVEIAYSQPSTRAHLVIRLQRATADGYAWAEVKLDFNAKKIYYYDSGGNYQEITDLPTASLWAFIYYPIKLVADFDTGYYVRLLLGGVEYDLSAYALYSVVTPSTPQINTRLEWTRITGATANIHLDDYILTMDEP